MRQAKLREMMALLIPNFSSSPIGCLYVPGRDDLQGRIRTEVDQRQRDDDDGRDACGIDGSPCFSVDRRDPGGKRKAIVASKLKF